MNIKALKYTLFFKDGIGSKKNPFNTFFFLGILLISLYLSYYYSGFFYFLSIPLLILMSLILMSNMKRYREYCKREVFMKNGSHTIISENNNKYLVNVLDGQRHGSFIQYHLNGQMSLKTNYKNGELDGSYKSYYENGQISKDYNYEIGKLHGEYKEYDGAGDLKLQTQYKEGIRYGETKSFYNNGNKYREFNLINNEYEGEIKEYFKNGNLKFLKDKNKYTFYDKNNNLKCEVEIEIDEAVNLRNVYVTGYNGLWKNYREDGTLEYELDFDDPNSDLKNKIVSKTIFTKGGELFSKNLIKYEAISMAQVNFSNFYAGNRMEESVYNWDTGLRGPPGLSHSLVKLKSISSINDIIKFL